MSTSGEWTHRPTGDRAGATRRKRRVAEQMELLTQAPLFAGLSKRQLRAVADVSGSRHSVPGDILVQQGAAGEVMFVIVEGTAKVVRNGRTVQRLGAGAFFGEMSILTRSPRSASVVADTPMECVTVSGRDLRRVLEEEPGIAMRMLTDLAARLEDADRRLA